jgi:hypothetical protein
LCASSLQSITWRDLKCITKRQADNLIADAGKHKQDVKAFLTIPPPPSSGGDGPEGCDLLVKQSERY